MPYQYHIQIIPGTLDFVKLELLDKFPDIQIINTNNNTINFSTPVADIFTFNTLQSPLAITNEKKFRLDLKSQPWRQFTLPASTNPPLAHILCQIAKLNTQDILYDPFCGVGTIPITALLNFSISKAFASDLSGQAIDYCEHNRQLAQISPKKLIIFRSNVSMSKLKPKSITKIISNLPFGIRTGSHAKNTKIYQILADKCYSLLDKNGKAIFLTQEKKLFTDIFAKKFQIKLITTINIGGLEPSVYQIQPILKNMISLN